MKAVNCPLCGSNHFLRIWSHGNDRFLLRVGDRRKIRFVICTVCGLAYANPQLDDRELYLLYTGFYHDTGVTEAHLRFKEEQAQERLEWLISRYSNRPSQVLEIGCGEGCFLRKLRDEMGWSVVGVEPNETYAQYGINNWGLNIRCDFFQSSLFPEEKFDLVVFVHVIEHIPDPVRFLREVSKILSERGHIFFETPNLWVPKIGRISANLFASPHLVIFSPKTIKLLLEKTGFELVCLDANRNLHVLAMWKGTTQENHSLRLTLGGVFHGLIVMVQYRYWLICELMFFAKKTIKTFLARTARRLLGARNYEHIRVLFHTVRFKR